MSSQYAPGRPTNPDYGDGLYRRRIRLTALDREVTGELEDDCHGFRVRVSHDGAAVTDISADTLRVPLTTCSGAIRPLRALVGTRLHTPPPAIVAAVDPRANCTHLYDLTLLAIAHLDRYGIAPRVALLSHSNFGSRNTDSALKMRDALRLLKEASPDLMVDGEMHGDSAISETLRNKVMPNSGLTGEANLLVFPNLDAANIALGVVKTMLDALHVGPILLGTAKPAHILSPSVTSRGVVNMATLAVVQASIPE